VAGLERDSRRDGHQCEATPDGTPSAAINTLAPSRIAVAGDGRIYVREVSSQDHVAGFVTDPESGTVSKYRLHR
jgi:hypothetical protein